MCGILPYTYRRFSCLRFTRKKECQHLALYWICIFPVLLRLNTNFIYQLCSNTYSSAYIMSTMHNKFLSYFKYSLIFSSCNITTFSYI